MKWPSLTEKNGKICVYEEKFGRIDAGWLSFLRFFYSVSLTSIIFFSDNFFTPDYSKKCVELLNKYPEVAVGLVSQSRLEKTRPEVIQMTPGNKSF